MFFGWNFWNDNGRIEGYLQNNLIFEYSWGHKAGMCIAESIYETKFRNYPKIICYCKC